jgi:hypothetical protein
MNNINPFAVRDGKAPSWREVNMTVVSLSWFCDCIHPKVSTQQSPVKKWKKILTDMYGEMPENDIVAIMGPRYVCSQHIYYDASIKKVMLFLHYLL